MNGYKARTKLSQLIRYYLYLGADVNMTSRWIEKWVEKKIGSKYEINEVDDDVIEDVYNDEYLNELFNGFSDDEDYDFYESVSQQTNFAREFNSRDLIHLWSSAVKWYKDDFEAVINMKEDERDVWNTIAYWAVKELPIGAEIKAEFKERMYNIINVMMDYNSYSRITCVICFENKKIYTMCSGCKTACVCYMCYSKLNNVCPCCRCPQMILDEFSSRDCSVGWDNKMRKVVEQIKSRSVLYSEK